MATPPPRLASTAPLPLSASIPFAPFPLLSWLGEAPRLCRVGDILRPDCLPEVGPALIFLEHWHKLRDELAHAALLLRKGELEGELVAP
eukprot:scaffold5863_cov105-Isochrysis_galbana.AAC.3